MVIVFNRISESSFDELINVKDYMDSDTEQPAAVIPKKPAPK